MFRSLGSHFGIQSYRSNRRQSNSLGLRSIVAAESRVLMAGNVQAQLQGGNLILTGDTAANDVVILTTAAGIIVRGRTSTTINGGTADFVAFATSVTTTGNITANLGAGNDKLQFDQVEIDGDVEIVAGDGDDQIGLTDSTLHQSLRFEGQAGDDTLLIQDSTVDGEVTAFLGLGDDLVALTSSEVKLDLHLFGSSGADRLALDDTKVGQTIRADMGSGNDDVRLANGSEANRLKVWGDSGRDLIQLSDSTVTKALVARLKGGRDAVSLVGTSEIGRFVYRGGRGTDSVSLGTATIRRRKLRNVQDRTVPAAFLTARIDNATTGLLAAVEDAEDAFSASTATPLTASLVTTDVTQANGASVTSASTASFNLTGAPGLTVQADTDNDGFDDAIATLSSTGTATIQVPLTYTDANRGANAIRLRQVENGTPVGDPQTVNVQRVVGDVVRIATSLGNIDIELFQTDAPITTANFVRYFARYEGSIIHRSARTSTGGDFIVQGGGFDLVPPLQAISTDAAITNEFLAKNSNLRGTLSMALPGNNINGGTSQWFINTANNAGLDSAKHTVFGRVLGTGMTVVDAIHDLTSFNISGPLSNGALTEVPLSGYTPFGRTLTGTASISAGSSTVTGVGTQFLTDLIPGAAIQIGSQTFTVNTVISNTSFTVTAAATAAVTAGTVKANTTPTDSQYVRINTVSVLVNTP